MATPAGNVVLRNKIYAARSNHKQNNNNNNNYYYYYCRAENMSFDLYNINKRPRRGAVRTTVLTVHVRSITWAFAYRLPA